jgi:uncharacterized protein YuzE
LVKVSLLPRVEKPLGHEFREHRLKIRPSFRGDSREISEGVIVDYDAEGRVVGIDIDNAGNKIDLARVLLSKLPGAVETEVA